MRSVILNFFLLISVSCFSQFTSVELESNFSSKQIKDLEKITIFFKTQLCKNEAAEFSACVNNLLPEIKKGYYEFIIERIDYNEQLRLYQSISQNTFFEIWAFCVITNHINDKKFKSLCSSGANKKYTNFLSQVGLNNKYIAYYAKNIISSGDFSSSLSFIDTLLDTISDEEINSPNIQLIIAIQMLTINDQIKQSKN